MCVNKSQCVPVIFEPPCSMQGGYKTKGALILVSGLELVDKYEIISVSETPAASFLQDKSDLHSSNVVSVFKSWVVELARYGKT